VKLSPHTAPIRQTSPSATADRSYGSTSSCFQLCRLYDCLTRPLRSSSITKPSSLLQAGPPQTNASVLSPRGFCPCASPLTSLVWFLQFRIEACIGLTPPIRRLPPTQSSGSRWACPRRQHHLWFRQHLISNDASSKGLLALVFPTLTCLGSCPRLFTRRSPPRLFTAAARAGLRSAPESRSRGAYPHLLCSFTTRIYFTFYSFRASAAHMLSLYLLPSFGFSLGFSFSLFRSQRPYRIGAHRAKCRKIQSDQ
jgi:hypothetical protein